MKSWKNLKRPEAVAAFLKDYNELCAKHGIQVGYWVNAYGDDAGVQLEGLDPGERTRADEQAGDYVYTYAEHE